MNPLAWSSASSVCSCQARSPFRFRRTRACLPSGVISTSATAGNVDSRICEFVANQLFKFESRELRRDVLIGGGPFFKSIPHYKRRASVQQGCGFILNVLENAFGVFLIGGNGDGSDHGSLPDILVIDFGYGHVEFVPQPIFEALDDLPLIFQRMGMRRFEVQV